MSKRTDIDETMTPETRPFDRDTSKAEPEGNRAGTVVHWSPELGPLVDYPGNPSGPQSARFFSTLRERDLEEACARGDQVLLTFERGRPEAPIIVGVLRTHGDAALSSATKEAEAAVVEHALVTRGRDPLSLEIDKKRIELKGKEEIVLRCGRSSLTLHRDGRVILRGVRVETRADGVNRIKGGSVAIN